MLALTLTWCSLVISVHIVVVKLVFRQDGFPISDIVSFFIEWMSSRSSILLPLMQIFTLSSLLFLISFSKLQTTSFWKKNHVLASAIVIVKVIATVSSWKVHCYNMQGIVKSSHSTNCTIQHFWSCSNFMCFLANLWYFFKGEEGAQLQNVFSWWAFLEMLFEFLNSHLL